MSRSHQPSYGAAPSHQWMPQQPVQQVAYNPGIPVQTNVYRPPFNGAAQSYRQTTPPQLAQQTYPLGMARGQGYAAAAAGPAAAQPPQQQQQAPQPQLYYPRSNSFDNSAVMGQQYYYGATQAVPQAAYQQYVVPASQPVQMMHQPQAAAPIEATAQPIPQQQQQKRQKNALKFTDPNTGQEVTFSEPNIERKQEVAVQEPVDEEKAAVRSEFKQKVSTMANPTGAAAGVYGGHPHVGPTGGAVGGLHQMPPPMRPPHDPNAYPVSSQAMPMLPPALLKQHQQHQSAQKNHMQPGFPPQETSQAQAPFMVPGQHMYPGSMPQRHPFMDASQVVGKEAKKPVVVSCRDAVQDSRHNSVDTAPESLPTLSMDSVDNSEEEETDNVDTKLTDAAQPTQPEEPTNIAPPMELKQPTQIAPSFPPEPSTQVAPSFQPEPSTQVAPPVQPEPSTESVQPKSAEPVKPTQDKDVEQTREVQDKAPSNNDTKTDSKNEEIDETVAPSAEVEQVKEEPQQPEQQEAAATEPEQSQELSARTESPEVVDHAAEENGADEQADSATNGHAEREEEEKEDAEESEKPKYWYKQGQWAPHNTEGEKIYDRDFLLQFREDATTKPKDLPSIPDIFPTEGSKYTHNFNEMKSFFPHVMDYNHPPRGMRRPMGRGGLRPGMGPAPRVIQIDRQEKVQLRTTENRWMPSVMGGADEADKNIQKKVRAILNKLTPENFGRLMVQIKDLVRAISTDEELDLVIELVHKKTCLEPSYSEAYAKMCLELMQCKFSDDGSKGKLVTSTQLRKKILRCCQQEFERTLYEEIDVVGRRKLIKEEKDLDKKTMLKEELDLDMALDKKKAVGNIKFVSELFKLRVLTEDIVKNMIIKKLLETGDDDSIEILCMMLRTIGRLIDGVKDEVMNKHFKKLESLQDKSSNRVGFMIQEIMEMRADNWKENRPPVAAGPKTRQQLHRDRILEEHREDLELRKHRQQNPRGSMQGGERGRPRPQQEDGFTQVQMHRNKIDPNKMKINRTNFGPNQFLGPQMSNWKKGAQGERSATPENRFTALRGAERCDSRASSGASTPSRNDSRERITRRSAADTHRETVMRAATMLGAEQRFSDRSRSRESTRSERSTDSRQSPNRDLDRPISPRTSKRTPEEEAKEILEEYMHSHEFQDCVEQMSSLPVDSHSSVVSVVIEQLMEKTQRNREMVGRVLSELISRRSFSLQNFCSGLETIAEFLVDLEVDIPRAYEYLGEILSLLLEKETLCLDDLKGAVVKLKQSSGKPRDLILYSLLSLSKHVGHIKTVAALSQSKFRLLDFFASDDDMMKYLQQKELQWLLDSEQSPRRRLDIDKIESELSSLIEKQVKNEEILDWVEENVGGNVTNPRFIHALVECLCRESLKLSEPGVAELDTTRFSNRFILLKRYIEGHPDLEVEVLNAMEHLAHSLGHPADLLKSLFEQLWNEDDLLRPDAFLRWKDSDSGLTESRGIARQSVRSFLEWIEQDTKSS